VTTSTTTAAPSTTAGPTTTVGTQQQPETEVKGVQVTRQLPRTGEDSVDLAALGAVLLLVGAGMVVVSNRRRSVES